MFDWYVIVCPVLCMLPREIKNRSVCEASVLICVNVAGMYNVHFPMHAFDFLLSVCVCIQLLLCMCPCGHI